MIPLDSYEMFCTLVHPDFLLAAKSEYKVKYYKYEQGETMQEERLAKEFRAASKGWD